MTARRPVNTAELAELTPDVARGNRDHAFIQAFAEQVLTPDRLSALRDPGTCPADLLPALIAEYSLEEFIEPGLPEDRVRAIIANRWALHEAKGYDSGIRLGLDLLGMEAALTHWHQETPTGPPNTAELIVYIRDRLFDEAALVAPRHVAAATRMIEATKRLSQDIRVLFGLTTVGGAALTGAVRPRHRRRADLRPVQPPVTIRSGVAALGAARLSHRLRAALAPAQPPVRSFEHIAAGGGLRVRHRVRASVTPIIRLPIASQIAVTAAIRVRHRMAHQGDAS